MIAGIRSRLEALAERFEELDRTLAQPDAFVDTDRWQSLSREHARLQAIARNWSEYRALDLELAEVNSLLDDPELGPIANEDRQRLIERRGELESQLELALLPAEPHIEANLFLEVRAGTGGDEAALFAGDLLRMYTRYAERHGWKVELLSSSEGEHGGFKEVVARIAGKGAYQRLKFESGTHRVQRVPATESQGRIHTSAATVAILPELDAVEEVELRDTDLRIDTFRASGAGGQHVNKTDSAIRITHLPSGIVIECQDERSQHKNRARAMALLKSRLLDQARHEQTSAQAKTRKLQVGSGDRSQRIRTYNFPQGRVTDHRISLTLHQLDTILQGDLDELFDALAREDLHERRQALAHSV